jgi:hypothetical protein
MPPISKAAVLPLCRPLQERLLTQCPASRLHQVQKLLHLPLLLPHHRPQVRVAAQPLAHAIEPICT